MDTPAILGGRPKFDSMLPIIRPNIDRYVDKGMLEDIRSVLLSNKVSSVNIKVKEFEDSLQQHLGVKHAIGMSSCTSGLMLVLQALGLKNQEVLLPAFTFSASVHALAWNNCAIRFVDIDPETFCISVEDVKRRITPKTKAILAVHMYGNPCDIDALQEIAKEHGLKLIFDAAHALGSRYHGKRIGNFGDAEIFSMSPTKLLTAIEGGIIATNDDGLAEKLRVDRNYGNRADYSCERPGLNARLPETNAVVGLHQMKDLDMFVMNRNAYAAAYMKRLRGIPGLAFPKIREESTSTYKDFGFVVNPEFGMTRDELAKALAKENIMTKFYFHPPMHKLAAYRHIPTGDLSHTEFVSGHVICLPIFNEMPPETISRVCDAIADIYAHRKDVVAAVSHG